MPEGSGRSEGVLEEWGSAGKRDGRRLAESGVDIGI
jgi:hypothetical protein